MENGSRKRYFKGFKEVRTDHFLVIFAKILFWGMKKGVKGGQNEGKIEEVCKDEKR